MTTTFLPHDDPELADLTDRETVRLERTLNLIAAENHAPPSVQEVLGSVFNTKTIEGYPGRRFHGGCIHADQVEQLAVKRGKKLFRAEHVNVQPHSGTSANLAVYFSVLNVGDRVLSMSLPHGGHLSHGHRASITSKCFEFRHYGLDRKTERIDYDIVRNAALKFKPRMLVAGASAYSRLIDYEKMARIAGEVSAYFMVDMAHLAGLVAAGVIPSPVPHSDFVTFTCYKTMMGGRGGVILCQADYAKPIDAAVFPGSQGTSAVSMIAAKALVFKLANTPQFIKVQQKTLENASLLATELEKRGYRVVSGGTENHQVIVDLSRKQVTGQMAEQALERAGMVTNRNAIPSDADHPGRTSGIRLGCAGISARGMDRPEVEKIAAWFDSALTHCDDTAALDGIREKIAEVCRLFPVSN